MHCLVIFAHSANEVEHSHWTPDNRFFVYLAIALIFILFLLFMWRFIRLMKNCQNHMNAGQFDEAMALMDKELKRSFIRLADESIYMQMSAIAFYRGDFPLAWKYMDRVVPERLARRENSIYLNNQLNLLLFTDTQAARDHWETHRDQFDTKQKNNQFHDALRSTHLMADFLLNRNLDVEEDLQVMTERCKLLPAKAQLTRFLGLIAREKGSTIRAKNLFQEAESICPGTYLGFDLDSEEPDQDEE